MTTDPAAAHLVGHAPGSREYRRLLSALACSGVATFAQLYSPQGILPSISVELRVTPDQSALLISAATLGLALGVLPWSRAADRIGRLPAIRLSLATATILGAGVAVWPSFEGILVLRVAEGIALGGVPALAVTYLQEEVSAAHAAAAAGTYVAGTSVGGLAGRIIAAAVADPLGWRWGIASVVVMAAASTGLFIALAPRQRGFTRVPDVERVPLARIVWAQLRAPDMLALYAQGFLLMGGFVAIYNYLSFRLQAAPYSLAPAVTSLLFLAYLAGTWSARRAGTTAVRRGRLPVLLGSILIMAAGVALTLALALPLILTGLVLLTMGFFGAHSIAAGWTAARARVGRAQAASLYNLFYYAGSSLFGWLGGFVLIAGWAPLALGVIVLCAVAAGIAVAGLRGDGALTDA